jgi:hypothetical protein
MSSVAVAVSVSVARRRDDAPLWRLGKNVESSQVSSILRTTDSKGVLMLCREMKQHYNVIIPYGKKKKKRENSQRTD